MLAAFFLVGSYLALGAAVVAAWRWRGSREIDLWDGAVRAVLCGLALWVAVSWLLALTHTFTQVTVLASAGLAAASAGIVHLRLRWKKEASRAGEAGITPLALLVVLPVMLWMLFVVVRATIVPVGNHDALAYHFPRAVRFLLDHGYRFAPEINDPRLVTFPSNYELLLATMLAAGQTDQGTILLSLVPYLGLGLVTAALTRRWWRGADAPLVTLAIAMSTPLVVLHSGAHKNDLLFGFFASCAALYLVRWALEGELSDVVFGVAGLALTIGTKSHGALVGAFSAPLLVAGAVRAWRRSGARRVLGSAGVFGVGAGLILGGVQIVLNLVNTGRLGLDTPPTPMTAAGPAFGDWENLWRFPAALLAAPFTSSEGLWVPWSHERYWWSEYDVFFGHYGALATLAVVFAIATEVVGRHRSHKSEQRLSVLLLAAAFAVLLPLRMRPYGMFVSEARYYLGILPFVLAWGWGGALAGFERLTKGARFAAPVVFLLVAAWFVRTAVRYAENDGSQPLDFVVQAALSDERAPMPFANIFHRRVAYLVDRVAGPRDVVAVDLEFDTWLYPDFGADFRRPVKFIPPAPPGHAVVPDDAAWVAIDRGQLQMFFGSPNFRDLRLSVVRRNWGLGRPRPEDVSVLDQLATDPRFELVYLDPNRTQALFRRR